MRRIKKMGLYRGLEQYTAVNLQHFEEVTAAHHLGVTLSQNCRMWKKSVALFLQGGKRYL